MKRIIFTVLCIAALTGCGLKGNLYMPKDTQVSAPTTPPPAQSIQK